MSDFSVPPVERSIKLLRYVSAGNSLNNLSAAARDMGINRTTLARLLATLEAERFVEQVQEGEYAIGIGLIEIAAKQIFSADVVTIATPILAKMAIELGVSAHLGILEQGDVLYIVRQTPNAMLVSNIRVGSRLPAYATTMGRILLAYLDEAELIKRYNTHNFSAYTGKTPLSLPSLMKIIQADKALGYSESESAFELGIDSIAAPIFDPSGKAIAAINVSGPEASFKTTAQTRDIIRRTVVEAAANISLRLGYVAGSHAKRNA